MGRAIVRDPKAFLMDEPLSNLDAKLRVQMRTEVARHADRLGTTTVYVTHDQTEAMTLGDRVAVMRGGVLQQVGAPAELYEQPDEPFRRRVHRLAGDELHAGDAATAHGEDAVGRRSGFRKSAPRSDRRCERHGDRRHPPESFEDASVVSGEVSDRGMTFKAKIELVESMGAEDLRLLRGRGHQGRLR